MEELVQSLLKLIRDLIESPEFRTLIIGIILFAAAYMGYLRVRIEIRKEAAKKSEELQAKFDEESERIKLEEQAAAVERERQLNLSLEMFRTEYSKERLKVVELQTQLENTQKQVHETLTSLNAREDEIKNFIAQQSTDQGRITKLENDVVERDKKIDKLETDRDEQKKEINHLSDKIKQLNGKAELERQQLLNTIKEKDELLTQKDQTIADMKKASDEFEKKFNALNEKYEELKVRIAELEGKSQSKSDTGETPAVEPKEGETKS